MLHGLASVAGSSWFLISCVFQNHSTLDYLDVLYGGGGGYCDRRVVLIICDYHYGEYCAHCVV
jgi:hypothetical protein